MTDAGQYQEGTPLLEESSSGNGSVLGTTSFPAFQGMLKGPTSVSPHPDTSDAETFRDAWDKEEGRGYQYDPHSSSILLYEYKMPAYIPHS